MESLKQINSPILNYITECYDQPHRKYHSNDHLDRLFVIATEQELPLDMNQLFALVCHDVFYYPGDPLNEELSAQFARLAMSVDGIPEEDIKIVETIILNTKDHIPTIEESKVIIDLDLWDLSIGDRFRSGSQLVKEEFVPIIGEVTYHKGRISWLKKFLARDTIFVSEYATVGMEISARKNLQTELEHLQQQGFPGCT